MRGPITYSMRGGRERQRERETRAEKGKERETWAEKGKERKTER